MSGGGGGIIIIQKAEIQALMHPLVHGALPQHMQAVVDVLSAKGTDNWTPADCGEALACFVWAALHC